MVGEPGVANCSLVLSDVMDDAYYHLLQRKLRAYNRRVATGMEPPDVTPLNIRVLDETGKLVGGLAGLTYWGWLVIKLLVLDEAVRGNGLGQQLIHLAHQEAIRRGCTRAQTMTYDFQALQFYVKEGYRVVGTLTDYPDDHHYYWLRKDFDEGEDG